MGAAVAAAADLNAFIVTTPDHALAAADAGVMEAYSLGLGEPIRLSAEHGEGLNDLYTHLMPLADAFAERAGIGF